VPALGCQASGLTTVAIGVQSTDFSRAFIYALPEPDTASSGISVNRL